MNHKILITGGCGYIGSHIAVELLQRGEKIVIIDNLSHSDISVLNGIKMITHQTVPFYCCDVNDFKSVSDIMSQENVTEVIHCAALKSISCSFDQPTLYYENNVCGMIQLVKAMNKNNINKLIFSSTASVYQDSPNPVKETSPLEIINPYAQTKMICENYLSDLYRSNKTWSICIFRYFNPIGAHFSGYIGEQPQKDADNILPLLMETASGIRKQFMIFGNDYNTLDGTGIRDYLHVYDLAVCHFCALQYIRTHSEYEVFNIGTGKGYSVLELIRTFEKVNHVKISFSVCERRNGDVAVSFADCQKVEEILGWKAQYSLDDMCRDAWNWHKKINKQI